MILGTRRVTQPTGETRYTDDPWPVGTHRVDVYVAGAMIASGSFEITGRDAAGSRASSGSDAGDATTAAGAAYRQANRLTDAQRFREALPHLERAIRLDPHLLGAYALRGFAHFALAVSEGRSEYARRAVEDYTMAIQRGLTRGVRNAGWHNSRGAIHMSLDEHQHARRDFDEALRIKPELVEALRNRGRLRQKTGDLDGSIKDFTRVIGLRPSFGEPYCQRGSSWLRKGRDAEAGSDFQRCSELDAKTREQYTKEIKKALEERKRRP